MHFPSENQIVCDILTVNRINLPSMDVFYFFFYFKFYFLGMWGHILYFVNLHLYEHFILFKESIKIFKF